jgi:hypothetical protein
VKPTDLDEVLATIEDSTGAAGSIPLRPDSQPITH